MALTISPAVKTVFGNKRVVLGTIAFDSSYPTGGEAFTVTALSGNYFRTTDPHGVFCVLEPLAGYTFTFRPDTSKIQVYSTAATEVSNATDLSALQSVKYMLYGN